ncbi:MAG TPA: hypothetical protein VGF28_05285 [Thermoanaerobaculia bacterium]|jgi:hypothetical protein
MKLMTCLLLAFTLSAAADELNAPFFRPSDLDGREIRFERTSAGTYTSETADATIDTDFGAPLEIPRATHHAPYTLPFQLPFFDGTVTRLHVTHDNALFLAEPRFPRVQHYDDLERQGAIAPMLTTDAVHPRVFVKAMRDAVRFTWRHDGAWQYTVQATLHRDGRIVFAYDAPRAPDACAMLLTSGAEPVREVVETIVV